VLLVKGRREVDGVSLGCERMVDERLSVRKVRRRGVRSVVVEVCGGILKRDGQMARGRG